MIVIITTKTGENKKAFIRNQIFKEIDQNNKPIGPITTSTIKSIYWPIKNKIEDIPIKEWMKTAEENNFWGMD